MKQISFLKFNDVNMNFHFVQHMSLDEIFHEFFQLQLKNSSNEIRSINCKNVKRNFFFNFFSIRVANENNEKNKFVENAYQCQNVLFFDFYVSKIVDVIEK